MNTEVLTTPPLAEEAVTDAHSRHTLRLLRVAVEDWCDGCRQLTAWEDANLLDEVSPQAVAQHGALLGDLERVGRWLNIVTRQSEFPDRDAADLVSMTLQDLADRRAMWHGNVTPQSRAAILQKIFPRVPNSSACWRRMMPS